MALAKINPETVSGMNRPHAQTCWLTGILTYRHTDDIHTYIRTYGTCTHADMQAYMQTQT